MQNFEAADICKADYKFENFKYYSANTSTLVDPVISINSFDANVATIVWSPSDFGLIVTCTFAKAFGCTSAYGMI